MLKLGSKKHRGAFLNRLNHCRDIELKYATNLSSKTDVIAELKTRGAPPMCQLVSDYWKIDGSEMPLSEAWIQAEMGGFATFFSCLPGQLVYFYDECGARRIVLEKHA